MDKTLYVRRKKLGTIKDIVDISTQLANSVNDRKITSELNAIQSLTLQLQSEQLSLGETNLDLKENLFSLKNELTKVKEERANLARKCSDLEKEVSSLRTQVDKKTIPHDFVERLGVLFKRDSTGSYLPVAHCPECRRPLVSIDPSVIPYMCNKPGCGYSITIHENLQSVAKQLNDENS